MKIKDKIGFSLVELTFAAAILIIILIGILYTYIMCFELNEFSRNLTLANNALQAQLEIIRETSFTSLSSLDGVTFTLNGFSSGQAVGLNDIYNTVYSDLVYIRLLVCWRQKSGRIIGEDKNLDGVLQQSEDVNQDGMMNSPAELITLISQVN